jgi:hypothetical protein
MVRGIDYPGWGKKMQRFYDLTNAQFGPWAAKFLSSSFFEELENLKNPDVYLCLGFAPGRQSKSRCERARGHGLFPRKKALDVRAILGVSGPAKVFAF